MYLNDFLPSSNSMDPSKRITVIVNAGCLYLFRAKSFSNFWWGNYVPETAKNYSIHNRLLERQWANTIFSAGTKICGILETIRLLC